ncbi:MAG: hypothetical protein JWN32_2034 [Solirubrobacterales bacterium]|nr:hypothetical protein [Solirubrobacterales bacterium]
MPRFFAALVVLAAVAVPPAASASVVEGRLGGVPALHGGRATLPLLVGGSLRSVRLATGWRIVRGTTRLDLGALRIGDRLRVPSSRRRVVVVRRGSVISFRALSERIQGAQGAGSAASTALHTFLSQRLDRPGAESLRTTLNTLDERVLSAADGLGAERQAIVAVVGSSGDAELLGRLQAAEDASHTASGQLEQAVTQLDNALSLIPPTGTNLPFDTVSTVPDLATSALNYLKQSLPFVGNLLQAILAGGG